MSETFKEANDRQIAMMGRAAHLDGLKRQARAQAAMDPVETWDWIPEPARTQVMQLQEHICLHRQEMADRFKAFVDGDGTASMMPSLDNQRRFAAELEERHRAFCLWAGALIAQIVKFYPRPIVLTREEVASLLKVPGSHV